MAKLPKVLHITNIAALYRTSLWGRLIENKSLDYNFVFGTNPYLGIKEIDFTRTPFKENSSKIHHVKNFWLKQKYLIWQFGVISKCLFTNAKMIILLDEFNVASNWIAAIICRTRRIHLVFRGHGMYGNETGLKLIFRKGFNRLANSHLVYERRSKKILIQHGFDANKIHVIFNSLDYDTHVKERHMALKEERSDVFHFFSDPTKPTLLFVGRLTTIKKLHLLIGAVKILQKKEADCNLLIVGEGPEKETLMNLADKVLNKGSYHFFGACYDEKTNAAFIANSDACVSPGNVGLTAIHCLALGTPIITHNNHFNQMPESEAIENGKTGILFEENNVEDLAHKIETWVEFSKVNRAIIREECYAIIDKYYNPQYQEKVITNLFERKHPLL